MTTASTYARRSPVLYPCPYPFSLCYTLGFPIVAPLGVTLGAPISIQIVALAAEPASASNKPPSAASTLSELNRRRPTTAVSPVHAYKDDAAQPPRPASVASSRPMSGRAQRRKAMGTLSNRKLVERLNGGLARGRITGYGGHTMGLINATGVQTGPYLVSRFDTEEAERHQRLPTHARQDSLLTVPDAFLAAVGPGTVSSSYAGHQPGFQFVTGL
ncbi:uncharacterized protein AMSG_06785 [Thecamonas trahens ATCC 50062]|uniref:Uncharacterized protein n=1 Tax=Thecamonas trahens ATCC 50062 TaxID=461836 RepID=A0A0L0DD95_THETB|nr:hypothetical protein AMSG_06785 [Thecamonas trahens ATCC 50062]KNC50304.1 hypothetical protein AMSG_06785 [Thecamonas trahens ATCC 50062]|eukprot:XP_013756851.1 hypothetical protein AMSG_06785 [Thecamonas trahens ATCC 50062]